MSIALLIGFGCLAALLWFAAPEIVNRTRQARLMRALRRAGAHDGLIPILIPVCDRPQYLERVLSALALVDGIEQTLVIFSQDGDDARVSKLIADWKAIHPQSYAIRHARPYWPLHKLMPRLGLKCEFLINANIHALLTLAFDRMGSEWAIVLEDDLVPGPDFLRFFQSVHDQIFRDPQYDATVLAASGWSNWDFSLPAAAVRQDESLLYAVKRAPFVCWSWAIDRKRWHLLKSYWWTYFMPWDGLVQQTRSRLGMYCLVPVISRVLNIGMVGINFGENPERPAQHWQTQSIVDVAWNVRMNPQRRLEIDPHATDELVYSSKRNDLR